MPQDLSKGKTYYTDIPGQYLYKIERRKIIKEMEVYKRKQWRLNLQLKFSYAANYHKLNKMRRNFVKSGDAPIIVLYYHRVANVKGHKINLPLENFAEQIDHITKYYEIVSLDEAHKRLSSGYNPDVAVAITFDDGYKDNLENALPILEKYNLPAIIYITTRFPEGDCRMWWYELWDIINDKTHIEFEWNNKRYHFPLDNNKATLLLKDSIFFTPAEFIKRYLFSISWTTHFSA